MPRPNLPRHRTSRRGERATVSSMGNTFPGAKKRQTAFPRWTTAHQRQGRTAGCRRTRVTGQDKSKGSCGQKMPARASNYVSASLSGCPNLPCVHRWALSVLSDVPVRAGIMTHARQSLSACFSCAGRPTRPLPPRIVSASRWMQRTTPTDKSPTLKGPFPNTNAAALIPLYVRPITRHECVQSKVLPREDLPCVRTCNPFLPTLGA